MTRIFLIRHGEVEGNTGSKRTLVGWRDLTLNERGQAQAEAVAQHLASQPLRAVYASDLARAKVTAERIAMLHGLNVQCDPVWREIHYGAWEGLDEAELLSQWGDLWRQRQADPVNVAPPEGESVAVAWQRLEPAWEALVERHKDETIALVGHNATWRVLLSCLMGAPMRNYRRIQLSNGGVSCVEIAPGQTGVGAPGSVLIVGLNDVCHLSGIM